MGRFAGTDTISRTPGALKITWLPPRPGLRHSTKFSSATACNSILAHLLKSFVASHHHDDTAFGITFVFCLLRADPGLGTTTRQFEW